MKIVKPRTEIVILTIVIAALLLYLALRDPDRVHYRLPELPAVTAGDIDRIEITRSAAAIKLEYKGGRWLLQPQGFASDPDRVKAIVDGIAGLKLTALVSESGNYFPYGLDRENAVAVKAFKDGRLLREFTIGSAAATYSHTHVLLAGDPRVFHAQGSLRGDFEQKADGLRDKTVMSFDKNEISAVEVRSGGENILLTKRDVPAAPGADGKPPQAPGAESAPGTAWLLADGRPGNGDGVNGVLDQLSRLRCEEYIEGKSRDDFQGPLFTLVLKGAKEYTLSIFPKAKEETSYAALSSESPYPFRLSSYQAETIMKKPSELATDTATAR
jgi:hypothetical protein